MIRAQRTAASAIDWHAALILYTYGWTITRIAEHYRCNYRTAWKHLKELGAQHRSSPAWHSVKARRIYSAWQSMRRRCRTRSHPSYLHYGGRGVKIVPEWEEFQAFHDWAISNGYHVGKGLVLIDHDRDFGPGNCRWGGPEDRQQERASRRRPPKSSCMISAFGEVKYIEEWSRDPRCKITAVSLARRLRSGSEPEAAIASPPRRRWDAPLAKSRKPIIKFAVRMKVDWDEVVRMHRERGMSPKEIATALGLSYSGVVGGLKKRKAFQPPAHTLTPERHRLSLLWRSLLARTTDRNHPLYASNGALGVRVCPEWEDFEVFLRWAMDTGSRPTLCLSRIVRRGPFSPGNCRWITRSEKATREIRRRGGRLRG